MVRKSTDILISPIWILLLFVTLLISLIAYFSINETWRFATYWFVATRYFWSGEIWSDSWSWHYCVFLIMFSKMVWFDRWRSRKLYKKCSIDSKTGFGAGLLRLHMISNEGINDLNKLGSILRVKISKTSRIKTGQ